MSNIRTIVYNVLIPMILLGLFGCTSYKYSNKGQSEQTNMAVFSYDESIGLEDIIDANNPARSSRSFISTDLLVDGANLAIQGVKYLIDESQKKYHAEYAGGLSNIKFYDANSDVGMLDPKGIIFQGFEFNRTFQDKNTDREIAVYAKFSLDESKFEDIYFNSKFYFKVDSLSVNYSKVKVNDSRWYIPWTWFLQKEKSFHLDFDIDLAVNWIDELGTVHTNVPFGKFILPVHDIPLTDDAETRDKYFADFKGRPLSGSSYMIPRSVTYCTNPRGQVRTCFGRGDFSISTKVIESSKKDFVSKMIMNNSDQILELKGNDIIKAIEGVKK